METVDPMTDGGPDERPPGWRYLEVAYDTLDRSQVLVDGVPMTDGRAAGEVIASMGAAGWEMVGSAADVGTVHVVWFRRPVATASAATGVPHASVMPDPTPLTRTVVLQRIGDARYDPERHAQLVATISELTGESGWRATRIVDKAPRVVAADVSVEEADRIGVALERLGATVEFR
jgi:ribosomal protein L7/L12